MTRSESVLTDAPLDVVWHAAATDFAKIGDWASFVISSRPAPPESGDGRICLTPRGETSERFVAFDEAGHTFTYRLEGPMVPRFVDRALNTWTAEAVAPDQTRLTMTADMTTRGLLGAMMGAPMRLAMKRVLCSNLEELKHYIETGEPHPRKRTALATQTPPS